MQHNILSKLMYSLLFLLQVSKGLWQKWGSERVIDTPITEMGEQYDCLNMSDTLSAQH